MSDKTSTLEGYPEPISWLVTAMFTLGLWAILSVVPSTSQYIPSPLAVWVTLSDESGVLFRHLISTMISATLGFAYGSTTAIASTLGSTFWKPLRRGLLLFAIVIYSVPLIAAAPLAALLFGANNSGAVLGSIGAYLPIFLSGLRAGDGGSHAYGELVRVHGGSRWAEIRCVRLPLMVRGWFIGAQSGWIWAVLGALLGDFTGGRWGLGTFLVGSLARGEPSRAWAIVVLCLVLSAVGVAAIRGVGIFLRLASSSDSLDGPIAVAPDNSGSWLRNTKLNTIYVLVLLSAWQAISWLANIDGGVLAGPLDLFSVGLEILRGKAAFSAEYLFSAFRSTWALAIAGVVLSLAAAFVVAAGQHLAPLLSRPVVLLVLVTQVTPIVAFVPLIAFYFGRGPTSVITIVVLTTIYPSYVVFLRALDEVPRLVLEVVRVFGGGAISEFSAVRIPHAAWMSIVALRLAVGRALLGAITAEYLLTGDGVGGILGQTRALLDFRIVWFVCVLVAVGTLLVDSIVLAFERALRAQWQLS